MRREPEIDKRTGKSVVKVSWVDGYGNRIFGRLIGWQGDFATCRQEGTGYRCRVLAGNLTYEVDHL